MPAASERYPDDYPAYEYWECTKCHTKYVDPEDDSGAWGVDDKFEVRLYWLNVNEPLCEDCAVNMGIPPIDKD